jgi:hypothetical protein
MATPMPTTPGALRGAEAAVNLASETAVGVNRSRYAPEPDVFSWVLIPRFAEAATVPLQFARTTRVTG